MKNNAARRMTKMIALLLAVMMLSTTTVSATAVEPRASIYLSSYQAYVYPAGGGEIQVWFSVTATDYMDELGALRIFIYESTDNINWTHVETFSHLENSNMLVDDDYFHMDHVTYQGVRGRYLHLVWKGRRRRYPLRVDQPQVGNLIGTCKIIA